MSKKNDFIEKFRQQYIDPEEISVNENTEFRNIGEWDSLTGMAIQVMIKDDYDVDLTVDHFKSLNTVGEIYDFVIRNELNKK